MAENIHYNPFSSSAGILTQEEVLEVAKKSSSLTIGIPRELSANENRIGLVPSGVRLLVNHGHRILLEKNAGEKSRFSDHEYAEAGAEIIDDHASVFGADIVLKIAPPLREEIDLLEKHRCLLSQAVEFFLGSHPMVNSKKFNALAVQTGSNDESFLQQISKLFLEISRNHQPAFGIELTLMCTNWIFQKIVLLCGKITAFFSTHLHFLPHFYPFGYKKTTFYCSAMCIILKFNVIEAKKSYQQSHLGAQSVQPLL